MVSGLGGAVTMSEIGGRLQGIIQNHHRLTEEERYTYSIDKNLSIDLFYSYLKEQNPEKKLNLI